MNQAKILGGNGDVRSHVHSFCHKYQWNEEATKQNKNKKNATNSTLKKKSMKK